MTFLIGAEAIEWQESAAREYAMARNAMLRKDGEHSWDALYYQHQAQLSYAHVRFLMGITDAVPTP